MEKIDKILMVTLVCLALSMPLCVVLAKRNCIKDYCHHEWNQGVSFEECKEVSENLKLPYPRSFYKCTKCDKIEVTVGNERP